MSARKGFLFFIVVMFTLFASSALALRTISRYRASYETPEILNLPDKITVEMRFRPLSLER